MWELEQTLLCEAKICDLKEYISIEGDSEEILESNKLIGRYENAL